MDEQERPTMLLDGCTIEMDMLAPNEAIYVLPQVVPYRRAPTPMGRFDDFSGPLEFDTVEQVNIPHESRHWVGEERITPLVYNFIGQMRARLGRHVNFNMVASPRTMSRLSSELARDEYAEAVFRAPRVSPKAVDESWKDYVMKKEGLAFEDQMDAALTAFSEGAA